jgi:hypothetical protein
MTEKPIPKSWPNGKIYWYHRAKGGRGPESTTGAVVSYLPGVRQAVSEKAHSMASEAWLQLAWHRKTGAAHIKVEKYDLDWYVKLVDKDPSGEELGSRISRVANNGTNERDRSAMSIEFGWMQTHAFGKRLKVPVHHDGLHILDGVMKRAAARHGG